jgi:hypothetical protein
MNPLEIIEVTYQEDNGNNQEGSVGFVIKGKERHTTDLKVYNRVPAWIYREAGADRHVLHDCK